MSTENRFKRPALILLAVICLVIFSVTGAMYTTLAEWFGGGTQPVATLELPSGEAEISNSEYQTANTYLHHEGRIFQTRGRADTEEIVAYATMRKLADEMGVAVSTQELRDALMQLAQRLRVQPPDLWRQLGYSNAIQFQETARELLRVNRVQRTLAASAAPTTEEVLDWFENNYQEFRLEYAVWKAEDFEEEAAAEEPDEETLTTFFESELTPAQARELETEEEVSFDLVVLTHDALESEAVQAWYAEEPEPTEDDLAGFYDFHRFDIYLREVPEEGEEVDPDQGASLSREELGDRIVLDYKVNDAVTKVFKELAAADDPEAFAGERGLEFLSFEEIPRSELGDLDRVGSPGLDGMFRASIEDWMATPYLTRNGLAYVMRPRAVSERDLPELEEIREEVVELWRDKRQGEIAGEKAEAFVEALTVPEDYVEGDPKTMQAEAFGQAVADTGREVRTLDWISAVPRPFADPQWGEDDRAFLSWLRGLVGRGPESSRNGLDDYLDDQIIGPLENPGLETFVVARLVGRRPADRGRIWPGEMRNARLSAEREALQQFYTEQLTFEGLARSYGLRLVQSRSSEEEEDLGTY